MVLQYQLINLGIPLRRVYYSLKELNSIHKLSTYAALARMCIYGNANTHVPSKGQRIWSAIVHIKEMYSILSGLTCERNVTIYLYMQYNNITSY